MRMLALKCESCGAPIDLPANTFEAECLYCNNRILIERSRPADSSKARSPESPPGVADDIARLDREWEAYRARYLEKKETGEYDVPVEEHCRMGMWATVILGAIAILLMAIFPPGGLAFAPVGLFILAVVGLTLFELQKQIRTARVYARSKRNYEQERLALLKQLSAE